MIERQPLPPSTRAIYAAFDFFGRNRRRIVTGILAVAVLFGLGTGFYIVKKEEQGVLTRFGKVVDAEVGPGWHYRVPVIEQVRIRKVKRILGYRIASKQGSTVNFTLLSGDTNLLEVDVALQYKIDNLRAYLFASSDPGLLLSMLVRQELVYAVGQYFIDLIFTSNREIIQRRLFSKVTGALEARDVGIELVALNIVDVRPIEETVFAFRDVNDAIAESVQAVSHANRRKERLIARTRGQAEALVMSAKAIARERLVQARSSAGAFLALLDEYRNDPQQVAITRYWQRMRTIFTEASLSAVNPSNESTIDINMIDDARGVSPVELAIGAPPGGDRIDRRLAPPTSASGVHAMETVDADRHLLSGQFHKSRTERDHLSTATPRSLIFDAPAIFLHRHAMGRGELTGQGPSQRPMAALIPTEGEGDDEPAMGKGPGGEKSAGGHGEAGGGVARKGTERKAMVAMEPGAGDGAGGGEGEGSDRPVKKKASEPTQ